MHRSSTLAGMLFCLSLITVPAGAALTAYDGFNYSPAGSDLLGKSGGFGFSNAWTIGGFSAGINTNYDIATGSLAFPPLLTSGNSVTTDATQVIAGLTRTFSSALGADGTTKYLSVLLRPEDTLHGGVFNGFFGIYLDGDTGLGEPDLFIGKPGGDAIDHYVVEQRGGAGQVDTGIAAVINQTALLVLKAEFLAGNDKFTLYVNPAPGGPEPAIGTVKNDLNLGPVSGLAIYSTGAFSIDEIRVGDTFADVTPVVPTPGAAVGGVALLGMMGLARVARARFR